MRVFGILYVVTLAQRFNKFKYILTGVTGFLRKVCAL